MDKVIEVKSLNLCYFSSSSFDDFKYLSSIEMRSVIWHIKLSYMERVSNKMELFKGPHDHYNILEKFEHSLFLRLL
jgi:hypothetical protein